MRNIYYLGLLLLFAFSANANAQELEMKQSARGKWGFVDVSGNYVIQPQYDWILFFSEGLAVVKTNNKWGFIDKKDKMVIPANYDFAWSFSEALASVRVNGKWGFVDISGEIVIQPQYDDVVYDGFSEGLAAVKLNDKWGFIDKSGAFIIEPQYELANGFSGGVAVVKTDGKYGFIDIANSMTLPNMYADLESLYSNKSNAVETVVQNMDNGKYDEIRSRVENSENYLTSFSRFARKYVQQNINDWQKRGEFEPTSEWEKRVNAQAREQKATDFTLEAEREYVTQQSEFLNYKGIDFAVNTYDADNQVFMLESNLFGKLLVPVPIDKALSFKDNWEQYEMETKYFVDNNQLGLAEITFISNTNSEDKFTYNNSESLNYAATNVEYSFDSIEAVDADKIPVIVKSDVDIDIPVTDVVNSNTFAVIISNENYTRVDPVAMSLNDGEVFKEYCHKTLGLPESNIRFHKDATYGDLISAVDDIKQISAAYDGDIDIVFYYSGHGFPDEQNRDAYLLPVDGTSLQTEIGYPLSRLYSELNSTNANHVTMFIDACFSGAQRDGTMLASARGIVLKPKMAVPADNMVVFTAASGNETAFPYEDKNHGLFTYYLLKKLQKSKGKVTLQQLGYYIVENVRQRSVVENKKPQTPTVSSISTRYLVPIGN